MYNVVVHFPVLVVAFLSVITIVIIVRLCSMSPFYMHTLVPYVL